MRRSGGIPAAPCPSGSGQVRDHIAEYLVESSWRRGAAQYIRLLAGEADIRGIALDGADSPLVQ